MAERHCRLVLTIERVTNIFHCTQFSELAGNVYLKFTPDLRVRIPPPLMRQCAIAPEYDETAIADVYGAVPQICSFRMQLTEAVFHHELARRAGEPVGRVSPRIESWMSLSPAPSPRRYSPDAIFECEDDFDVLPTAGRFGLWTVAAFDLDSDSRRKPDTPRLARCGSGESCRKQMPSPRFASSSVDRTVHLAWALGDTPQSPRPLISEFDRQVARIEAQNASVAVDADGVRLHCEMESGEDGNSYGLFITAASVLVPKTAPIAAVLISVAREFSQ